MPNIRSAKKRVRSNARKRDVNTLVNSSMRTAIKNCEKAKSTSPLTVLVDFVWSEQFWRQLKLGAYTV